MCELFRFQTVGMQICYMAGQEKNSNEITTLLGKYRNFQK